MRIAHSLARRAALALVFLVPATSLQAAPIDSAAVRVDRLPNAVMLDPGRFSVGAQLPVPLFGQQTNVWCWDASSLMVIKYFRPATTLQECDIAKQATPGATTCCGNPFAAPCVHTGWEMLSANGFTSTQTPTLSWKDLVSEISTRHKPVLYAIGWHGGGGHMLVATGWFTIAGQNYVHVNDPWPPPEGSGVGGAAESPTYDNWLGGSSADYDHNPWAYWTNITDTRKPYGPIRQISAVQLATIVHPPGPDPMRDRMAVQPEVTQRATRTLDDIRSAPPGVTRQLGFPTAEEAKGAQLGTPIQEYTLTLSALRAYTPGTAAPKVLSGGTTYFYPVVANGVIRSSVRVSAQVGQVPKLLSIGDTGTAARLQRIEELGPQLRKAGGESIPAVRIPAMGLYFIARKGSGGTLEIASTFDVPNLGLRRGAYESAEAVFARLAPFARNIDDKNSVM